MRSILSLAKKQVVYFLALAWILASILIWLIYPTARKGPLGFGSPASMTTFQANDRSFSIEYPGNWIVSELPQGNHGDHEAIAFISVSGHQLANVIIARKSFLSGNINGIVVWGQARAEQHPDYVSISFHPVNDGKMNGFIHEYTWSPHSLNNITSRCQDFYTFANGVGYSLSFCSQDRDWASLSRLYTEMRQSFSAIRV